MIKKMVKFLYYRLIILKELVLYMKNNKQLWLLPLFLVCVLVMLVVILLGGAGKIHPFLYPLI